MGTGESALRISVITDTGKVRRANQDAYFAEPIPADKLATHGRLLIVADGMGGHAAGEVASALAIDIVSRSYYDAELASDGAPGPHLRKAFQEANVAILRSGTRNLDQYGMGTTCTAILLREGSYWCSHVGDSRVYRLREGKLECMTTDHTLIKQMVDQGEISEQEAERLSIRHILVRAMGIDENLQIDISEAAIALRPEDKLLICSDGLHSVLSDEQIAGYMNGLEGDEALRKLVVETNDAGGPDNITIVLVEPIEPV